MKILVCDNMDCQNNKIDELLEYLDDNDVEYTLSSCLDMCEDGPIVFTFPDLKMYGYVDKKRLEAIVTGNSEGFEYNQENSIANDIEYRENPMHKRTVKLFRWHLAKHDDLSIPGLEEIIRIFQIKYDVKGNEFTYPVKVALINTVKGPDLPVLINYLGKNSTMKLFDEYLKKVLQ